MKRFYCGCHQPSDAKRFEYAFVSINRLRERVGGFKVFRWVLDSAAFTEVTTHGGHRYSPEQYAEQIRKWRHVGQLDAAVAQDWMCEDPALERTGLTMRDHQRLTVEYYDRLIACDVGGVKIMPVIQGREPDDYRRHVRDYGSRLDGCDWIGVGSVCKRDSVGEIEEVISAVREEVPSWAGLHGFGVKTLAFANQAIADLLETADSQAWSRAARWEGRNQNDWREGAAFVERINEVLGFEVCKVYYPPESRQGLLFERLGV